MKSRPIRKSPSVPKTASPSFFTERRRRLMLMVIPPALGALFVLLLFDVKISEGNDDSMYIEAAWNYSRNFNGYFYSANAPLYPMFLGLVTMFSGLHLVIYKVINSLFYLAFLFLMYRAFANRLPWPVLLPVLLLCALNDHLLYFASQTYTEIPYLMLLALFFLVFFQVYPSTDDGKVQWKGAVAVAFLLFMLTLTRNIAIGVVAGVVAFMVWDRAWQRAKGRSFLLWMTGSYISFRLIWTALTSLVWGIKNQYSSQQAILKLKNPYNAAEGTEDAIGYVMRLVENTQMYTSKRLMQLLGFRDETDIGTLPLLTLVLVALTLWCVWMIFKSTRQPGKGSANNFTKFNPAKAPTSSNPQHPANGLLPPTNSLPLIVFTTLTPLILTFIVLQSHWESSRIILVYLPFWVMIVLYGIYIYFYRKGSWGRWLYVSVAVLLVGSSALSTVKKAVKHYPVLVKNLQGDVYYGYTPDWENYLRLSTWCADSLPPSALVACRKAPMSFVYGKGKHFFPVYNAIAVDPVTNFSHPDSVLTYFAENGVTHVMVASLRMNPAVNNGIVINTIHRMLLPVVQKYPDKLKLVKRMGMVETAEVYELTNNK